MSLKDKAKIDTRNKLIDSDGSMRELRIYFEDDVKKAILELSKYTLFEAPYKPKCDSCGVKMLMIWTRDKYKPQKYHYCRKCLIKEIFGDWE